MIMTRGFILAALVALLAWHEQASAEVLQFRAQIQGGGAGGQGVTGDLADDAFHAGATGASYGALVGVEVLFIDGWIEHNQFVDSQQFAGTWTQFMVGLDTQIDIGAKDRGGSYDDSGELTGDDRYSALFADVGMGVGFGVGTGQQVDPPLDNSEVTDKGFLAQIHLGLGYRVSRPLSVGVTLPVQAGYMFKSGPGAVANDRGTQYASVQAAVLFNLRLDVTVK
jgi:hypothetical protein